MASLAYHNNPIGSDNIEATWKEDDSGNAYVDEFEIRQYYVHRERQSYSLSFDWKFNENHKIELRGMYNRRNDWENRYRLTYKDITPDADGTATAYLRRQTKGGSPDNKFARLERQQTADIALSGEHNLGWLGVEWGFDYARASEDRPNERYIGLESDEDNPIRFDVDLSDEREPRFTPSDASLMALNTANFIKLDELNESFSEIEETEYKAHIDLRARLFTGTFECGSGFSTTGYARFGVQYSYSARPRALRVHVNATVTQVTNAKGPLTTDDIDPARVYVCITNWTDRHSVESGLQYNESTFWDPAKASSLAEGAIIGYGSKTFTESTDGWVTLTLPIYWYDKTAAPAAGRYSLVISCSTSAYGDYTTGSTNNRLYVEDFEWVY